MEFDASRNSGSRLWPPRVPEPLGHWVATMVNCLRTIRTLVSAVAPKPVNVLLIGPNMRVAELADAGVRRVSVGGALAAAAWAAFDRAARLLIDEGTLPKRD